MHRTGEVAGIERKGSHARDGKRRTGPIESENAAEYTVFEAQRCSEREASS